MYTLSANPNVIIRDIDGASIPMVLGNGDFADYLTWLKAGNTPTPLPVPTAAQLFAQARMTYTNAVQDYIISIAQKKGYRDDVSCASYFNDPHIQFSADAQAFVPWRSAVWLQCYADLATIQAGTMLMPASPAAYILTLPAVPAGF